MRPISSFAIHALAAAALTAFAATSAAAAADFLRLGGAQGQTTGRGSHDGEIEIQSWSWGATQGEVVGIEPNYTAGGESRAKASPDMTVKGTKIDENARRLPGKRTPPTVTLKRGGAAGTTGGFGGVKVASGDVDGSAAGITHSYNPKEMTVDKQARRASGASARPPGKGSVWVRVASPWAACRVGARYPSIELGRGAERFVLRDVAVSSCGAAAGGGDLEEVSFTYRKVELLH